MKKIIVLLTIVSIFVLGACGSNNGDSSSDKDSKTLIMGTSADYPPYEFIDTAKGGEPQGFDIDIAKAVADKLGYKLKIENMTFKGLIPALNSKRVDFVMAGMTPTDERKEQVDFSQIYYNAKQVIVTTDKSGINSTADLDGKKIGVQLGAIQEQIAKKLQKKADLKVEKLDKVTSLAEELKSGRIDGFIVEDAVAANLKDKNKDFKLIPVKYESAAGSAVAFPKGSKLKDDFDKELSKMIKNGDIDELSKKWFKLDDGQ